MEKTTLKELREKIAKGYATDVTSARSTDVLGEDAHDYEKIEYCAGVYGCNGLLIYGKKTGNLYAVIGRGPGIYTF